MITMGHEPDPAKRIRRQQGKKIREVRRLRELTVVELAASVGVTHGAVTQWETGKTSPRQPRQLKLAEALDVPWSFLFGLDETQAQS